MKCVSFENFWSQLNTLSSDHHPDGVRLETIARAALNINPEGELLRETHDIIEELRMMAHIFSEQLTVAERFSLKLRELYDKESTKRPTEDLILETLKKIQKTLEHLDNSINQSTNGKSPKPLGSTASSSDTNLVPHIGDNSPTVNRPDPLSGTPHGRMEEQDDDNVISNEMTETNPNSNSQGDEHKPLPKDALPTIPKSTVQLAEEFCRDVKNRRQELVKLEESTEAIALQVRHKNYF